MPNVSGPFFDYLVPLVAAVFIYFFNVENIEEEKNFLFYFLVYFYK